MKYQEKFLEFTTLSMLIIPFLSFNTPLPENNKYFTPLTGLEEVPPVNTNSRGIALFQLINN